MPTHRKVILYIAASLDGYIEAPGDDLSFLSLVEQEGEDYGYGAFIKDVDTVIVGRRTYEKVLSIVDYFPHADKEAYIITRTPRPPQGNVTFYTGSPEELVQELKSREGKNIFVDGGAEVVHLLLQKGLSVAVSLAVVPFVRGRGPGFFRAGRPQQRLRLVGSKQFEKGLVQLHYLVSDE